MCNDGCKCGNNQVKTKWIDMPHGEQLMFAVPPEGENEVTIDRVEELKGEVILCVESMRQNMKNMMFMETATYKKDMYYAKQIVLGDLSARLEKIFEKY